MTASKDNCMLTGFNCMKWLYHEWCDWSDYIFETYSYKPYYKKKDTSLANGKKILSTLVVPFSSSIYFKNFPFLLVFFFFLFCVFPAVVFFLLSKKKKIFQSIFLVGVSGACMNYLLSLSCVSAVDSWELSHGALSIIINDSYKLFWGRSLEILGLFLAKFRIPMLA